MPACRSNPGFDPILVSTLQPHADCTPRPGAYPTVLRQLREHIRDDIVGIAEHVHRRRRPPLHLGSNRGVGDFEYPKDPMGRGTVQTFTLFES